MAGKQKMVDISKLIGKEVMYTDYLGFDVLGNIVHAETDSRLKEDEVFLYISDEIEISNNNKVKFLSNGTRIPYAEIRKSSEVILK